MKNKVFLLELNEFNRELVTNAADRLHLPFLKKITQFFCSDTFTQDTYESDFLEPWVQWVSVHTGRPSTEHHIKHLGDVPHLGMPQLWEALSEKGKTSGVWGAMNASRNNAKNCLFFVPDPWTASEQAFPAELNDLLAPLRYSCQNYTHRSNFKSLQLITRLLKCLKRHHVLGTLFAGLPELLSQLMKFQGKPFVFISFLDYISTKLFLQLRQEYQPDFSLLFLNSIAHLQHHHWHGEFSSQLELGFRYIDKALECIFSSLQEDEIFIVLNALSQKNTNEDRPWILYRQIDQKEFLEAVGIHVKDVKPHMTYDAHLFFETEEECKKAQKKLESARILNQPLFLVETYTQDPKKLFYRVLFTDQTESSVTFTIDGKPYPFLKLFKAIVQRTGKHIPKGTLYCNQPLFPTTLANHEVFGHLLEIFSKSPEYALQR